MKKNEIFQIGSNTNSNISKEELLEFSKIHNLIFPEEYRLQLPYWDQRHILGERTMIYL